MADDILKTEIDIDLTNVSKAKLTKDISEGINDGINDKKTTDSFKTLFDFKAIKKDTIKNLSDAFGFSGKQQAKQNKIAGKLKGTQEQITKLIGTQGKGFKGNAKLMGLIGKKGMTAMSGIAAKANPIMLAIQASVELFKEMADQLQRITEESAKFVGQGSIFTDKNTMGMMQLTGQTATESQATNRSLGAIGLSFSDIQSGKITAEQAALFEQLRNRELEKLEKIDKIAGPMMKSLQQVALGFTLLMQDMKDYWTLALSQMPGIEKMIGSIKGFLVTAGTFARKTINLIAPLMSIVADVVGFALDVVNAIMPALGRMMTMLKPTFTVVAELFSVVSRALGPILNVIGLVLELIAPITMLLSPLGRMIVAAKLLLPWIEKLGDALAGFGEWMATFIMDMGNLLNVAIAMLKGFHIGSWTPFEDMEYLDVEGLSSTIANSTASYENQNTNNYIYGNQEMNDNQNNGNSNDLFSNSYVLVND